MDYKELINKQLKQLPEYLRSYVVDREWVETLESLLVKYSIEEYKKTLIENELFLVLIGLESYKDLGTNIQNEANIDQDIAEKINNDISKTILKIEQTNGLPESNKQKNVGNSFEQIILNQARAMQPARPAGEIPHNLPTENNVIHNYIGDKDPYREPTE